MQTISNHFTGIEVEHVSKVFHTYLKPSDRIKQFASQWMYGDKDTNQKQYFIEHHALKDVSFGINPGESWGIVGKNGSGKSTLLQIIAGTMTPTSGAVKVGGRLTAILELGAGFRPEFTGIENIYFNGLLIGLSKSEIDAKLDEILAFADIGGFAKQPVKTYSSGMLVRLAFAVQAQVDPDILIVDEALAVGDARFQSKCFNRLNQLKANGACILFVSHSAEQIVTHCSHSLLLNSGNVVEIGAPRKVVNRYMDLLFQSQPNINLNKPQMAPTKALEHVPDDEMFDSRNSYNKNEYRWGDKQAIIHDYILREGSNEYPAVIMSGSTINIGFKIRFIQSLIRPILGININTKEGVTIYGTNTELLQDKAFQEAVLKYSELFAEFEVHCPLVAGDYFISVGLATRSGDEITPHDRRYDAIHLKVISEKPCNGLVDLRAHILTKKLTTE